MCAAGLFIVTPEEADGFGAAAVLLRADDLGAAVLSVVLVFVAIWLHPLNALPVCSTAEWLASQTRPLAVSTLQMCLNEQSFPLLQPFGLL